DKTTWVNNVLPVMGKKLGIKYYNGEAFTDIRIGSNNQLTEEATTVSLADWSKITSYFQESSPAVLPAQNRPPVQQFTTQFTAKEVLVNKGFPSATYVKIDPGNKWLYAANATDSSIYIFDKDLHKLSG